jgi:hypothetical protein
MGCDERVRWRVRFSADPMTDALPEQVVDLASPFEACAQGAIQTW